MLLKLLSLYKNSVGYTHAIVINSSVHGHCLNTNFIVIFFFSLLSFILVHFQL